MIISFYWVNLGASVLMVWFKIEEFGGSSYKSLLDISWLYSLLILVRVGRKNLLLPLVLYRVFFFLLFLSSPFFNYYSNSSFFLISSYYIIDTSFSLFNVFIVRMLDSVSLIYSYLFDFIFSLSTYSLNFRHFSSKLRTSFCSKNSFLLASSLSNFS